MLLCVGVGGVGGCLRSFNLHTWSMDATPRLTFVAFAHISIIRNFEVV